MESRSIKILAIDDNKDNLSTLQALITDAFSKVVVLKALSGQLGLELATVQEPDVILLDIDMPKMDGFEVCARLKADKKLRDIPVVFVTAINTDKENRIKALECGVDAFLSKPIDEIELIVHIRSMLKIRAANIQKRDEKKFLSSLVEEKTRELKDSKIKSQQLLEAVKREQALIEAIFDSIPGYLYVYDESGRLIKWNKKHETMTGYSTEELSHMTLEKWFDQEDIIKVSAAVNDVFKKGYGEVEASLILKNGEKMMILSSGVPLILDGHKYFAGIGVDITEHKRIEHEIKQREKHNRTMMETTQDGFWIVDLNGQITDVNQAYCRMTGYTKAELLGSKIKNLDVLENPEETEMHINWLIENGSALFETRHKKKDGDVLDIEISATYVDRDAGIFAFCRNITERKKAEAQLKQNLNDLLESQRIAHLGTWRLDLAKNQVVWSNELYKMYGFDPTIPLPPYSDQMKFFTPASWDILSTAIEHTSTTGIPYELELETVKSDGSNGWMWARGEAVKDSNDKITGLWGAVQDITERKKIENQMLYLSYHDHLTELNNRRFFEMELIRLDTKENFPLSIIMCDVNGLKLVNDSFGHDKGDALLKKAAEIINKVCRKEDVVARIGGDEFVVLLPKTSANETVQIANQIKELASKEMVATIELSISYGYDTKTTDKQSMIEIIANAENHMYRHKLYERSSIRSKTIDLIMNALFEKSNREAAHSNRVGSICQLIASQMNFTKDAVNQMKIAGSIHDIGKIGIDEKILNKPGRLTIDEKSDIERHPEIGWRLLSSTNEFSELAQFVLNHHEKWDGSGYPNGLKGEEIQLEARIISVADAYDAMTSERSYRKGLSKSEAIKELTRCSGSQFDPTIVNIFVNRVLSVL